MRINANMSAIIANQQLSTTENKLTKSLERLSSGYKINHSKDNPAGLAISQKMRSQLRGLEQSDSNAQDGVSVLQTAEGALTEIQSMLARMKELSVQAANDVNSEEERGAIQKEMDSLSSEINRIAKDTDFNTKSLLGGDLERRVYSNIPDVAQADITDGFTAGRYGITVTADAAKAVIVGNAIGMAQGETITKELAGTVSINGLKVEIEEGDDLGKIATKLAKGTYMAGGTMINVDPQANPDKSVYKDTEGYESVAADSQSAFAFISNAAGSNESITVECDNPLLATKLGISEKQVETGKDVEADFTNANGKRVGFANSATMATYGNMITVKDNNDKTFVVEVPINVFAANEQNGALEIVQEVTDMGTMRVHVGANENQLISINIPEVSTHSLGLDNLNVYTHENAGKAISAIDEAITRLNDVRSRIGAYQNRLEHTTNNLAVSNENLTYALSRIMDVDMAKEMTEYTQANVLAQAGTSILSQANARPETALQLLQR